MIIQQAIHGYDQGHRMLESSINLTCDEDIRLMNTLSDWSGASLHKDDSYITFYPLIQSHYYVIAKTWYAEELTRPGCVWTHSLLIEDNDLKNIRSFNEVLLYFRRPRGNDMQLYSTPILIVHKTK